MVFPGNAVGVSKSVYATVLTFKVGEFIGFSYHHSTNFNESVSLQSQPSMFFYYEVRIYRKLLPLEIHTSSRSYFEVRQNTSKILFITGDNEIK